MRDALRRFILDELLQRPGHALGDDDDLLTTGLIDSIGIISLVQYIEDETDLEIPAEDVTIEHFLSIAAIDRYLTGRGAS